MYLHLKDMLNLIDDPYGSICKQILIDNRDLFEKTPGSTHNHQTWIGGYIDHITDGMNYGIHLYKMTESLGRPLPFSLSDVLLIFYLHDLEKPWRIFFNEFGEAANRKGLDTKLAFKQFRENKLKDYGIVLTEYQLNGLTYVEGELGDYSSKKRVMNELAAFCHMIDVWSARGWYDYPKINDEWVGATRFRSKM